MKINNKILLWFLVIAIIPSGITGFFGYQIARDILKKYVYNQLSTSAEGIHDRINSFLEVKKERIVDFSSDGFIRDQTERLSYSSNLDYLQTDLSNHLSRNKIPLDVDILEIFVMNMHGEIVASSNPQHVGLNRSDEDYFTGEKRQDIYVTDLHHCIDADGPVIEVSRLLSSRRNGESKPIGVIVNRIKGSSLINLFIKDKAGDNTLSQGTHLKTYILNSKNQVIAGSHIPKESILKEIINTEPIIRLNESGEEIIDIYQGRLGNQVFGASMYIDKMDWLILVEEDVDDAFADIRYLRNFAVTMKFVTICLVILLAVYISRGLTLPIKSLLEGTKRLGKGMLGYRISIASRDEIGELADSFNTMADSFQERTEALNKSNKKLELEIMERKAMEVELNAAKVAAEKANMAKSEFLANMSHEIRTPMNGVMAMTEILLDTELSPEQHEYAETVRNSADSLLYIINEILDFSKIEDGKLEIENIDFDLGTTLDGIVDIFSVKVEKKGLEFLSLIDPAVPLLLRGDPGRLRQVMINLISNAIKFTDNGEVAINVTLAEETETHATARFAVKDTGIGIPADRMHRLFKSFSQVDASTTRKYGGTGLGLAISRQIAELMRGQIGVESEEGRGTTFWFTAVLEKQTSVRQQSPFKLGDIANIITRHTIIEDHRKRASILVAEDNLVNQKIALRILDKKLGYHAEVVCNGREAIDSLKKVDYDLVLMDCQMPEVDGYEATRAIRDVNSTVRNHKIPIVAMTANAMKGDREKCLDAGMDDYITKPINVQELADTIERNMCVGGKQRA